MKWQIFYRLTDILSFYAFLRPVKDLIRATYMTGPKSLNGYRGELPFERYQTGSFSHIGW